MQETKFFKLVIVTATKPSPTVKCCQLAIIMNTSENELSNFSTSCGINITRDNLIHITKQIKNFTSYLPMPISDVSFFLSPPGNSLHLQRFF